MKIVDKVLNGTFPTNRRLTTDDNQVDNEIENVIIKTGLTPEAEKSLTGTASSSGTTITGSSTLFLSELRVGDLFFETSNPAVARRIVSIASNTSLTIASAFPSEFSGVACSVYNTTQLIQSLGSINKYAIWGFVPSSGATPDEQINMTKGKALCEDGHTFVELPSDESDIDFPTLNGGALSNSTTYHLFRYIKNDNTYQWYLSTSLTPTISDILSAKAYRRIFSAKTDSSGDLIEFIGYKKSNGAIEIIFSIGGVNEGSSIQSATKATITLSTAPLGLPLDMNFTLSRVSGTGGNQYYALFNPNINPSVNINYNDISDGISAGTYDNGIGDLFKTINTSSQISHKGTTSGSIELGVKGYIDYRNYF